MALDQDFISAPFIRDDDEGLFSRDFNGQLIRLDAPDEHDYQKTVTLQVDGQTITVPLAEPLKDASGNIIQDLKGRTTPRYTTIYDAVVKLCVKEPGDEARLPVPILCHQPHMTPVAVCRLCVVQIYGQKRGKRAPERKLLPACQHPVKEGMEVFTMKAEGPDGDRVRDSVRLLTGLLAADHLKPVLDPGLAKELAPFDELAQMTERCGAAPSRFEIPEFCGTPPEAPPLAGRRKFDGSSPVFVVNHAACILCDRCVRACGEVVKHKVIGRTGKGATAGIGFDLNDPMGNSSCVRCGECMMSCPTSAITFKPTAQVIPASVHRKTDVVPMKELLSDPVFAGIPPKFLLWQRGLVIRRRYRKGDILFRQGDAGNTAFVIKSGKLEIKVMPSAGDTDHGVFSGVLQAVSRKPLLRAELTPENLMVGEMACLNGTPRTATLRAIARSEVWELRRNVLDRLMRLPSHRGRVEADYRGRSLLQVLHSSKLFKGIELAVFEKIYQFMRDRLSFVRVSPGQYLFHQGDTAGDMYLVRLGFVRVGISRFGKEFKVVPHGPGSIVGEIGLLGVTVDQTLEELDQRIKAALENAPGGDLAAAIPPGIRTASCSALDHLELARLSRADGLQMLREFPVLRRRLIAISLERLRGDEDHTPLLDEYVRQGLYEGQSLLTLDLDLCTRCDECTKACVQQHGTESHGAPMTRMLRDGLRFANYLVATACRSCTDAYCMVGCPVDSIHRGRHRQIVIEDHCIGCGLCAENCPYGNIFMAPNQNRRIEVTDPAGHVHKIAQPKAITCDLCDSEGKLTTPYPRCVAACPHEAAHRMTGPELFRRVSQK